MNWSPIVVFKPLKRKISPITLQSQTQRNKQKQNYANKGKSVEQMRRFYGRMNTRQNYNGVNYSKECKRLKPKQLSFNENGKNNSKTSPKKCLKKCPKTCPKQCPKKCRKQSPNKSQRKSPKRQTMNNNLLCNETLYFF